MQKKTYTLCYNITKKEKLTKKEKIKFKPRKK